MSTSSWSLSCSRASTPFWAKISVSSPRRTLRRNFCLSSSSRSGSSSTTRIFAINSLPWLDPRQEMGRGDSGAHHPPSCTVASQESNRRAPGRLPYSSRRPVQTPWTHDDATFAFRAVPQGESQPCGCRATAPPTTFLGNRLPPITRTRGNLVFGSEYGSVWGPPGRGRVDGGAALPAGSPRRRIGGLLDPELLARYLVMLYSHRSTNPIIGPQTPSSVHKPHRRSCGHLLRTPRHRQTRPRRGRARLGDGPAHAANHLEPC